MNVETASTIVVADRFPVKLIDGDDVVHATAKLVLTRPNEAGVGRVLAYSAPGVMLYDTTFDRAASFIGPANQDWVLDTPEGRLVVRTAPGCGCGNRLKGWVDPQLQPLRMGRLT